MKKIKELVSICMKAKTLLLVFLLLNLSSNVQAGIDTTLFRINIVQDSVYAGDTLDVDLFIGGNGILGILNILNAFEIEVGADTSLIKQDDITFRLDSTSLESFFGTVITNITTITTIDPILGKLNIKTNSTNIGNGNARVGRGKYIVQDNAAGRQYLRYDFSKAISKDLLGFNNPVKIMTDSVLIINRPQIPTAVTINNSSTIRISPNPVRDIVSIEGERVQRYRLLSIDGKELLPETKANTDNIHLTLNGLDAGTYILLLQINGRWSNYKIVKE